MSKPKQPGTSVAGVGGTQLRRVALLGSVSMLSLFAMTAVADARPLGARSGTNPAAAALPSAEQAAMALQRTSASLARTSQALQAMRAAQNAARIAATAGATTVPNGQVAGGLVVDPAVANDPALWSNAQLPKPDTLSNGRTRVEVVQTAPKAILTWQSFNVGRETDLYFNQTAGGADAANWIALNRVTDPGIAPSRILGTIKADGQVYVINKNGIIFGGASQVNVASLVASSLSLSNTQFLAGINIQRSAGGASYLLPQFGEFPTNETGNVPAPYIPGNVLVEAGARIVSGKQGLVALFGSNVANRGTIETPSGQTLLAAGENVYLGSNDAKIIGLRAYVSTRPESIQASFGDAPALYARTALVGMNAVNDGMIVAPEGNISIVGYKVVQNGLLQAVTTLNAAGNISLIAHDGYRFSPFGGNSDARAGELILGRDSITTVQIDRDPRTGTGGTVGDLSFVRLWGNTVLLEKNALVQSEAGQISVGAFSKFESGSSSLELPTVPPGAGSRFMMEAGSVLDVAGVLGAEVAMESNSVQVEARANELRDAPLQRNGILAGKKIWVDRRVTGKREDGTAWIGTELVDANEYDANVPKSMGERAVKGGKVTMYAGEVVVMPDAEINLAGGSVRYLDGYIKTTKLVGADGRLYDIGRAPVDMPYVSIYSGFVVDHSRWKVSEVFTSPFSRDRFEKGYVQGAAAGMLEIHSRVQVLDGRIAAHTIVGDRQISSPPAGGALKIGSVSPPDTGFNANHLRLQAAAGGLPSNFTIASALPTDRTSTLVLSTEMLSESGLSSVELILNGNVVFAPNSDIRLRPGSILSVNGGAGRSMTFDGSIRVPGGLVGLSVAGGPIVFKAGAKIDVSGQWTNYLVSPATGPRTPNGGSIGLTGNITFESDVVLAADAGATVSSKGKFEAGTAGSISLGSSNVIDLNSVTMSAYGLATSGQVAVGPLGGHLSLAVPAILIATNGAAPGGSVTRLDPSFFDRGGFSKFTFTLAGIEDGLTFAPKVQTKILAADDLSKASNDAVGSMGAANTLSAAQRPGTSLALTTAGDFVLGANTVITPGTGGSVSLAGGASNKLTIAGTISAPAGSITLTGNNISLASTAQLLARGVARIVADGRGLRSGDVLDGGSVIINPTREGNLAAGALIDVSGTSGTIDVADNTRGIGMQTRPLTLASDGGRISISGSGGLVASTLVGNAGGAGAAGGSLLLSAASPTVSVSSVPTTVYFQDANGLWQSRTATQDIDIFNEYSGAAITLNSVVSAERTKFINATRNGSGGLLTIINDDTLIPGAAGWENVSTSLQEVDPTILQNSLNAAALYTKYFYSRSGTSPNFVYTKLNYTPVISEFTVRQSAFRQGGFADISLTGSKIGVRFGDGVDISADRRISVTAATVSNWSGASAIAPRSTGEFRCRQGDGDRSQPRRHILGHRSTDRRVESGVQGLC